MFCGLRNVKYGNKDMHFLYFVVNNDKFFRGRLLNKVKYTVLGGKNGNFRGNI